MGEGIERRRKKVGVNEDEVLSFCHVALSPYLCFGFLDEKATNEL